MPANAVRIYNELISSDAALAADSQAALDKGQDVRGLVFNNRPVCSVLRPSFLSPAEYRFIHDRVKALLPALRTAFDRAVADAGFRRQFRLHEWEEDLLSIEPGFPDPSPTSRFDAFLAPDGGLHFTEYNAETPAGTGYSDSLTRLFYGLPIFQEFERHYQVWPVLARPGVLHALMDSYRRWQGHTSEPPRVAILDWREAAAFAEFVLIYDWFRSMGLEARIVDPRDVEYRDGKLVAGDYHITLVYRRVHVSDLVGRGGIEHPVVRAVRDGAACMVNSFRCKVLDRKATLAVLSDERNMDLFTPAQQETIAESIPWTRLVEDRHTSHDGTEIDLVPYILSHKDRFVLKPNDGHGGQGIILGWSVAQSEWEQAVRAALSDPHVVQERVALTHEPFPAFDRGSLQLLDRLVESNPYVGFGSYMHGCLTRVSAGEISNVTAGGSIVPTFVVEPR